MGKRVRISNDSLNSYGTRIITAGLDTAQYERNPVLLYMHERGQVVGYVTAIEKTDSELTGELMFDGASELSERCRKQFEFGSLRMVSAGLDIIETSADAADMLPGQTRPTITRSRLVEVSVADIGANDDALVLSRGGRRLTLAGGTVSGDSDILPLITNNKNFQQMETKKIALAMGLAETATDEEVTAALAKAKADRDENGRLRAQIEALELKRIENMVGEAISDKKIEATRRRQFIELGKKIGADELKSTIEAMQPRVMLADKIKDDSEPAARCSYTKLSEVPAAEILGMRLNQPDEYRRLYKAEYGFDMPGE